MRTGIKTILKFQLEETKVKERNKKNQKSVKREKSSNRDQQGDTCSAYDSAIPLLGIYARENTPVTWPPILTAGLLVIA